MKSERGKIKYQTNRRSDFSDENGEEKRVYDRSPSGRRRGLPIPGGGY
jgi:hypothetical protein